MDRTGRPAGQVGDPGQFANLDLTADDQQVAASMMTGSPANMDIWTVEARNGQAMRITDDPAPDQDPMWSPDGAQLVFNSGRRGRFSLFRRPGDGSGEDELLVEEGGAVFVPRWSPDRRFLAFSVAASENDPDSADLWTLDIPANVRRCSCARRSAKAARPSRRMAAGSRTSRHGRDASKCTRAASRRRPGGVDLAERWMGPRWRRDGGELFFLAPDGMLTAVGVSTTLAALQVDTPRPLFPTGITVTSHMRPYAVASDGQRFLIPVFPRQQLFSLVSRFVA
jgi:hypothetical protein